MAEYEKAVREILAQHQCRFLRRGKGGHDIWYSPITQRSVTESNHGIPPTRS